jgi:hypothetical protein
MSLGPGGTGHSLAFRVMRLCRPALQVDLGFRFDPMDLIQGEDLHDSEELQAIPGEGRALLAKKRIGEADRCVRASWPLSAATNVWVRVKVFRKRIILVFGDRQLRFFRLFK